QSLRDRFQHRLSQWLGVSVSISENQKKRSITIFLSSDPASSQCHMMGMDDEFENVDTELGPQLISRRKMVQDYRSSMKEAHAIINFISTMTRILPGLQQRLKSLLRRIRSANSLYHSICTLGSPEPVYNSWLQAAANAKTFRNVTFYSFFRLEMFFKTPEKRESVYRLKQFIQTDDTVEPPDANPLPIALCWLR
ncbi:hypothetical protein BKA66DRAFT_596587, partial [Pyrenochaeta sp. MPI-SDFR-AT-0127]